MILTPELGSIFEVLGDAFCSLIKEFCRSGARQEGRFIGKDMSIEHLWQQTWKAVEHEPS